MSRLGLDEDLLVACVSCGLCLPHCPTYRSTEEESASPRGRIALMRAVELENRPLDAEFVTFMERCVQCRGCETACPSGVQFGRLMETTREVLAAERRTAPSLLRFALWTLGHHRLLMAATSVLALAMRARLVPRRLRARLSLPAVLAVRPTPLRPQPAPPGGDEAWLFTGCVMDAWQRPVHAATIRVMEATGAAARLPGEGGDCCGALHTHAGLTGQARKLAERVMGSMPGSAAIVVNSAGCGAALKDYGHLLDTPAARTFSARVQDVHEWLAARMDLLPALQRQPGPVAIQDPCHLRHVQRAHEPVRRVLAGVVDVLELDDDGRCCGAGGSYSLLQPELARRIRDDKVRAVQRTGANVVVSANPGCALWLASAGLRVRHPIELVDDALVDDALVDDALVDDALVDDALVDDALVDDALVAQAAREGGKANRGSA